MRKMDVRQPNGKGHPSPQYKNNISLLFEGHEITKDMIDRGFRQKGMAQGLTNTYNCY